MNSMWNVNNEDTQPREVRVATIQVALPVTSDDDAADLLSDLLAVEGILDWQYVRFGGQWLYATRAFGAEDNDGNYVEGSAFQKEL